MYYLTYGDSWPDEITYGQLVREIKAQYHDYRQVMADIIEELGRHDLYCSADILDLLGHDVPA